MSVTFGTPASASGSSTTPSVSLTGLTAGQPVILVISNDAVGGVLYYPTGVTDTNGLTWTSVVAETDIGVNTRNIEMFIGTGAGGTSTTISATFGASSAWTMQAVGCMGASTASGSAAIDSLGNSTATSATISGPTFTPNAIGGGAVFACRSGAAITTSPGSPWTSTASGSASLSTYPSPPVSSLTTTWDTSTSQVYVTAGIVVKGIVVTFNANGGSGTMSPETASSPTALTLNSFTYAGHTFDGWNTLANGTGTAYADGATYPFTVSATLYAQWGSPPSPPTLTSPVTAAYDDVSGGLTFSATFNSTDAKNQNAYAMRMKISSDSYGYWNRTDFSSSSAVWNSITTLPGASWSVTIPAGVAVPSGTFSNGSVFDWSFASQEASLDLQGSFATDFVLNAVAIPVVTVTAPTGTTTSSFPVVTWGETLGTGVQTAYQVIIEFGNYGTSPGNGATAWNSGVVGSNALSATCANLLSPQTYRCFVQITQTGGQTSAWGYSTTTIPGTIAEVPGTYDVAIGGHGYMIDTTFEFGRRDSFRHSSIPAQRDATDITNQPGEGTINPQGLWRSEFNDWSMGSGQLFVDRKESFPNRFHHSQGVDVFTNKWYAGLLPDTTELIADTDTTCQVLVVNGFLIKLNSSGVGYSTNGTTYTALTGLSGTPVSMCSDGASIYIACGTGGVYTCVAGTWTTSQLVDVSSQDVYFVAYCSNVLLVADGTSLYQISGTTTSWPTALITQPEASWTWNSACGGNGWIYLGGFAGTASSATVSSVYKTQFASDGTTLAAPAVATPLPPGEAVYSLFAFVNYILMGTSLGMRFCQTLGLIDPSGQDTGLLKIGPIIPNLQELATKPVRCFTANQRFVYFGWSNYSASTVKATDTCTGLGWLDISTFTGDQTPAYSSNLMVGGTGEVTSMDWWEGAPVFTVKGKGVYTAASTYVPSGNIYSGYISFRIPDQKILVAYSVDTTSATSSVGASINQDDENTYSLGIVSGTTNLFSVPQVYGELFETDLTLYATVSDTVGTTLRRATLQAFPAITAGKNIITALRFWDELETRAGRRGFYVYQELAFLEGLRQAQTVVTYQEGTNTWSVVVDDIDFVEYEPSALPAGGFQGICMVTLKTASSGLIT